MKRKKKTYGVRGLMEWHALIPCGSASIDVHFKNGALTAYGITPARYTTDHPVIQAAIERSDYFAKGRIVLLESVKTGGEEADEIVGEIQESSDDEALTEVKMSCNDDAKDYLSEQFGVSRSKLLTRSVMEEYAKEHGVKIVWEG